MTTQDPGQTEPGEAAPPEATSPPRDASPPEAESASAPESLSESGSSADVAPSASRPRPMPSLVGLFALALAFFAAAAAGFLWWQYRQFYVALDRADGEMDISLRDIRADLRALEDRLGDLGERDEELTRAVEQVVERTDTYAARFSDFDQRLAAAQGISAEARGRWLRAQAEYLLGVANTELMLRGDRGNAIEALELADETLLEAGSPTFAAVRERIAGELLALRGMRPADIEGLSYSLSRLAARVPELPMRAPAGDETSIALPGNEAEPGLARLWQSFKNALTGMVRFERRDPTAVYSLSRNQQTLVRRQLELELTLARLALVQGLGELFATSVENARTLLEQHFAVDQPAIEGALSLLREMQGLEVAPSYPDISGSLALLRSLPDRDN